MLCDFGLSLGINYCLFGLFIDDIEQQFPSKSLQSAADLKQFNVVKYSDIINLVNYMGSSGVHLNLSSK
jgi:hypothetical protein